MGVLMIGPLTQLLRPLLQTWAAPLKERGGGDGVLVET